MTRENKIGLLVGLGFIVVFAVLLSHTGTPPGESTRSILAENSNPVAPVRDGAYHHDITSPQPAPVVTGSPAPGSNPEAEPTVHSGEALVRSEPLRTDLPAPTVLEDRPPVEVALGGERRTDSPVGNEMATILGMRKAPQPTIETPEPTTVRPEPLTVSAAPVSHAEPVAIANATTPSAGKTAPSLDATPSEYVVQKRDTITSIAEKQYGSSNPRLIALLVKSNEGRIKNADTVVEGQKLVIPNLPPEMFENVPELDVRTASGQPRSVEDALKAAAAARSRQAPKSVVKSSDADKLEAKKSSGSDKGASFPGERLTGDPSAASLDLAELTPVSGMSTPVRSNGGSGEAASGKSKDVKKPDSSAKLTLADKDAAKDSRSTKDAKSAKDSKDSKDARSAGRDAKDGKKDAKDDRTAARTPAEGNAPTFRWYEIKRNDTMANIAREELGSAQRWEEIKKLNGGVDPQKMRPGAKIKLPRKPVSAAENTGRVSA